MRVNNSNILVISKPSWKTFLVIHTEKLMHHYTATLQRRMTILEPKYLGKTLAKLSYLGNIWMKLMKRHLIADILLSNITLKHLLEIQILHFCHLFKYCLSIHWFQCWNICSTLLGHKDCVKVILVACMYMTSAGNWKPSCGW